MVKSFIIIKLFLMESMKLLLTMILGNKQEK